MTKLTCVHKPKGYSRCMLLLYIVLTLTGLSACQPKEINLPFETIERQELSGYRDKEPALIVIAKPEEIASLDALVSHEIQSRLQTLDYDAQLVVVIFQGWKPTTRYGAQIDRVTRRDSEVTVYAEFSEPKSNEPTGDLATSPYHMVRVQKMRVWGQQINFNLVADGVIVAYLSHYVP